MTDEIKRLRTKLINDAVGDGPLERQLLLVKLTHALESLPEMGDKFVGDFKSPQQQWLAQVGALLKRVSLSHEVEFESALKTCISYWKPGVQAIQRQVASCIEELKLELELAASDQIGQVYEAGKVYDFFADLKQIVGRANAGIFVVDPYFDGSAFHDYLSVLDSKVTIRIFANKYAIDLNSHLSRHVKQFGSDIQLRISNELHDRLLFIDEEDCWSIGASIKDGGKKATYILPLPPELAKKKLKIYEEIWRSASLFDVLET